MTDTPTTITAMLEARYRELTPAQRVRMATGAFGFAVALVRAGVVADAEAPLSHGEVRRRVLERLYGAELSAAQIEAVAGR